MGSSCAAPIPSTSPGEVLAEEFINPMCITHDSLASALDVSPRLIHSIIDGNRAISTHTARLFGLYFGTSAEFWINLQARYDSMLRSGRW
ncbi:HigA family addiction module antitoxin [Nocardia callitridis]|uniref:HigA family addiction module antitoxin n=1 Tax=Nocardia callitridis TaxID=648753 RepID=UPI0031EA00BC